MPAYRDTSVRFWEKVEITPTCWLWTAGRFGRNKEYGCFYLTGGRKAVPAHVWAYEQNNGKVPNGLVLDHLCRNTLCVRPTHLEVVTHQVNILRGEGLAAKQAKQTHCKHGHSLEDAYILMGGRRHCRTCQNIRNAKRTQEYRKVHG